MQFVKRIGDNAVAVVEVVEKGFEGGKLSFHSFRFELFVKSCNIGFQYGGRKFGYAGERRKGSRKAGTKLCKVDAVCF